MTCQCTNPNHNHGACSIEEIARDQEARQRLTCDPPAEPSPLGDSEGDELPRCANCAGAHHIQRCPELRDPYGISLSLRASIRADAAERVEYAPF